MLACRPTAPNAAFAWYCKNYVTFTLLLYRASVTNMATIHLQQIEPYWNLEGLTK